MDSPANKPKRPRPSPQTILRGHTSALTAVTFLPRQSEPDRYLITGDEKGTIRLWDTTFEETLVIHPIPRQLSATPVQSVAVHSSVPTSVLVHYKTGHVVRLDLTYNPSAADLDSWTVSSKIVIAKNLPASMTDIRPAGAVLDNSFCRIAFLSPNTWAGPGADGNALILRDTRHESIRAAVLEPAKEARTGMLMSLARAGTDLLLTGYEDGSVAVWDTRKSNLLLNRTSVAKETILATAVSPFGRVAAVGGGFDMVAGVADLENDLRVVEETPLKKQGIADIAWRHDGKLIATAGWDGAIRIWDGRRRPGSLLRSKGSFLWHDGSVHCVAYSCSGTLLASGGKDRTVALWNGI